MLLTFDYIPPPDLSGLTTEATSAGLLITWVAPIDQTLWGTEIWYSESNDRSTATLLETITAANHYTLSNLGTGATTFYFWIRAVGIYNQTNGNWYPVSSTAGISGISGLNGTFDITANAITETTISTSLASTTLSAASDVFEDIISLNILGLGVPALFQTVAEVSAISIYSNIYNTALIHFDLIDTTSGGIDTATLYSDVVFNTVAQYNSGSQGSWVNIKANANATDGVFAVGTTNASGLASAYVYDFDFASVIPSTAKLLDIKAIIVGKNSGGTGNATLECRLCWDGSGFSITDGIIRSNKYQQITLTATNDTYIIGSDQCITATWGHMKNEDTWTSSKITMDDIRTTNFGLTFRDILPSNGRIISIDYISLKVYYSTKDYIYSVEKIVEIDPAPANIDKTSTVLSQLVHTLTNGDTYNYKMSWIKHVDDIPGGDDITLTRNTVITTIQEFKNEY